MNPMNRMRGFWSSLTTRLRRHAEQGATAVEYGLMVALIAAVIAATVLVLGNTLKNRFDRSADCVSDPSTATKCTTTVNKG